MYHAGTVDREYKIWCIRIYIYIYYIDVHYVVYLPYRESHLLQSDYFQVESLVSLWSVSVVSIVTAWLGYTPSAQEYPNSLRSSKNTQNSQELYR